MNEGVDVHYIPVITVHLVRVKRVVNGVEIERYLKHHTGYALIENIDLATMYSRGGAEAFLGSLTVAIHPTMGPYRDRPHPIKKIKAEILKDAESIEVVILLANYDPRTQKIIHVYEEVVNRLDHLYWYEKGQPVTSSRK